MYDEKSGGLSEREYLGNDRRPAEKLRCRQSVRNNSDTLQQSGKPRYESPIPPSLYMGGGGRCCKGDIRAAAVRAAVLSDPTA